MRNLIYYLTVAFISMSCYKEWLDVKPNKKMVVASNLEDVRALLDNTQIMNMYMPDIGEVGCDDYFVKDENWASAGSLIQYKNAYLWSSEIFEGETSASWNNIYQQIFYANLAIESLSKLPEQELKSPLGNNIHGSALFHRAWAYFQLAQIFCLPYDQSNADVQLGLPLRTQSDINLRLERSSLSETYNMILSDLNMAELLLPEKQEKNTRPSKASVFALKANYYLQLQDFVNALLYASKALEIYNSLIDYNEINPNQTFPFPQLNKEVIFHSAMIQANVFLPTTLHIDTLLYRTYETNDLRRELFFWSFANNLTFRGSYNANASFFNGFSVDEMLLIKAECNARLGNSAIALSDFNHLQSFRYKSKLYTPITDISGKELIDLILLERRKQLLFRGRRWWDIRRLNKETDYQKVLVRNAEGKVYKLDPSSNQYSLPIPDDVIKLSGIKQNPR